MEMEFFVPPDEAPRWYEHWKQARHDWYVELGLREDHLRMREHDPDELSHYSSAAPPTSSTSSRSAGASSRASPTAATSTSPSTRSTPARSSSTSIRRRRSATSRTSSSRPRAPTARRWPSSSTPTTRTSSAASSAPCSSCTRAWRRSRSPSCRTCARTACPRSPARSSRALRGADAERVRRGRLDRQALPPPGRDRHAVLRHGRPPDAGGPARSRCATATRSSRSACAIDGLVDVLVGAAGAGVALAEGRRRRGLSARTRSGRAEDALRTGEPAGERRRTSATTETGDRGRAARHAQPAGPAPGPNAPSRR